MTDRKPQKGDVYRLPDVTVVRPVLDGIYVTAPDGGGTRGLGFGTNWFLANATFVRAAPREFKVGDRVRIHESGATGRIIAIYDDRAWVLFLTRPSTIPLSALRHADEAEAGS